MMSSQLEPGRLAEMFIAFDRDEGARVPLYGRICRELAATPDVLSIMEATPVGQRRPSLFLAALHREILRHPNEPAARWFPSVTGRPVPEGDPWPSMFGFIVSHRDAIESTLATKSTQTNEPNRSALWWASVREAGLDTNGQPIALIELGSSAGLNLRFDSYHYDFGDRVQRGHTHSEVAISCAIRVGTPPLDASLPPLISRIGIDLEPVGVNDVDAIEWLRACIWAEQTERRSRFNAAVSELRDDPPTMVRGDAVDEMADAIEAVPSGDHVVIIHSWFLTYLRRDRRIALDSIIDTYGRDRTITLISAEASGAHERFVDPGLTGDDPEEFRTVVGMSRWRHGVRTDRVIARCHAHLAWLDWLA